MSSMLDLTRPQLGSLSLELCALYEALKVLRTFSGDDNERGQHLGDENEVFKPRVERIVVVPGGGGGGGGG
eukprot:scaffold126454_cov20-Tisochrysis_lutea.AAC.2